MICATAKLKKYTCDGKGSQLMLEINAGRQLEQLLELVEAEASVDLNIRPLQRTLFDPDDEQPSEAPAPAEQKPPRYKFDGGVLAVFHDTDNENAWTVFADNGAVSEPYDLEKFPWRETSAEAQNDLDNYAVEQGLEIAPDEEPETEPAAEPQTGKVVYRNRDGVEVYLAEVERPDDPDHTGWTICNVNDDGQQVVTDLDFGFYGTVEAAYDRLAEYMQSGLVTGETVESDNPDDAENLQASTESNDQDAVGTTTRTKKKKRSKSK